MAWLARVIGVALVLLAVADIYLSVLYPRGGKGIASVSLSRRMWQLFRLIARALPRSRNYMLSFMGPTLVVAVITMWVALLIIGFALICWPALGTGIQMDSGATPTDFATAIYYSGYSITTLGTGDITPRTTLYRLLMILEAMLGFSVVTMTLTFLESVYSRLIQRNVFALSLHHRTGRTADAAEMLARLGVAGSFDGSTRQVLTNMSQDLLNILESHHSYPALGYFHMQETYYALPRSIFVVMDAVTLIKSALQEESYFSLIHSAAVTELGENGVQFLLELSESFLPKKRLTVELDAEKIWQERYNRAVKRLAAKGVEVTLNRAAGAQRYVSLRREWEPYVKALAEYMQYEWSEIALVDHHSLHVNWQCEDFKSL